MFGAHAPTNDRLAHIDSLRGVACLLVLYLHSVQWMLRNEFPMAPGEADLLIGSITHFDPGRAGVLLFFVISGFVVPWSLRRDVPNPLREFAVNRFFRLLPGFWLSIAIGAPIVAAFLPFGPGEHHNVHIVDLKAVVGNLFLAPQVLGRDHLLKVYWTLQVELIFYFMCIALSALGLIYMRRLAGYLAAFFLVVAVACTFGKVITGMAMPIAFVLFFSLMFWGFAAREAMSSDDPVLGRQASVLFAAYLVSFVPMFYFGYSDGQSGWGTWESFASSYLFAVVVFWALAIRRPWSTQWASWIGRVSYSIYLFHALCIEVVGWALYGHLASVGSGVVVLACFTATSIAVSAITFYWLEVPMMRFGRAVNMRWRATLPSTTTATR